MFSPARGSFQRALTQFNTSVCPACRAKQRWHIEQTRWASRSARKLVANRGEQLDKGLPTVEDGIKSAGAPEVVDSVIINDARTARKEEDAPEAAERSSKPSIRRIGTIGVTNVYDLVQRKFQDELGKITMRYGKREVDGTPCIIRFEESGEEIQTRGFATKLQALSAAKKIVLRRFQERSEKFTDSRAVPAMKYVRRVIGRTFRLELRAAGRKPKAPAIRRGTRAARRDAQPAAMAKPAVTRSRPRPRITARGDEPTEDSSMEVLVPASDGHKWIMQHEASKKIHPLHLKAGSLESDTAQVPRLQYGLDRALFNPGVALLKEPRSRVYNFDPYLEKIIDPRHFDFDALDEFRTPSNDDGLSSAAKNANAKYFSSTSAMTGILTSFHFLLSNWRPLNLEHLSLKFVREAGTRLGMDYAQHLKMPQSIYLIPKDGSYAIDSVRTMYAGKLSLMGQCLEKLLTVPKEDFENYKKGSAAKPASGGSTYNYTKFDSVLVRSQLDARDPRLPGGGIFDLKTRAVLPIRMDTLEKHEHLSTNYELRSLTGLAVSFEREFFDMCRATLIKYLLQVRLGRMDGIFVAYHNIVRMFGFQYLTIADMDLVLHNHEEPAVGDAEMNASIRILQDVLEKVVEIYPGETLRLDFQALYDRGRDSRIVVFAHPVTTEEIEAENQASLRASREYIENLNKKEGTAELEREILKAYEEDMAQANDAQLSVGDEVANSLEHGDRATAADSDGGNRVLRGTHSPALITHRLKEAADQVKVVLPRKVEVFLDQCDNVSEKAGRKVLDVIVQRTLRLKTELAQLELFISNLQPSVASAEEVSELRAQLEEAQNSLAEQEKSNREASSLLQRRSGSSNTELDPPEAPGAQTLKNALQKKPAEFKAPPRLTCLHVRAISSIDGQPCYTAPVITPKTKSWELTYNIEAALDPSSSSSSSSSSSDAKASRKRIEAEYVQMRQRKDTFGMRNWSPEKVHSFYKGPFFQELLQMSEKSRVWREKVDEEEAGREKIVYSPGS